PRPSRRSAPPAAPAALLAGLNDEQRAAVTAPLGPVLVLAGAGSGKTRVLTVRIAHLVAGGAAPDSILAVTFTNKAAAEMRERLARVIGGDAAARTVVGTFHAFCLRTLREHGAAIGLPAFTICDAADQLAAARSVLRDLRVPEAHVAPAQLQARISLAKNRLERPEAQDDDLLRRGWLAYDEHLRRNRQLDFDDLLLFALRLLEEAPAVRAELQRRHGHVLVDEYQDTNRPQYEIVRRLAETHRSLFVVGDDDQAIYGWRGADVGRILGFAKDFRGATTVRLQTNYRSTAGILELANRLIACNVGRHEKTLRSALGDGDSPKVVGQADEEAEAAFVAQDIAARLAAGARPAEFAVLLRTAVQTRPFETALRAAQVPYRLVGGPSFYDRKEVRDVLAYLRLLVNPDDETSLLRIANTPPRGIGKASLDRLIADATAAGRPVGESFDRAPSVEGVTPTAAQSAHELRATLRGLSQRAAAATDLVALVRETLVAVTYKAEIERCPTPEERADRTAGVNEVLNVAENLQRRGASSLRDLLDRLTLAEQDERTAEAPGERVMLMTLHAAKGLEWPRVYLAGCEETLLPHQKSIDTDTVPEERRLMYVGITRAQRQLTMTFAATRSRYGSRSPTLPSRFLYEATGQAPPPQWRPAPATGTQRGRRGRPPARRSASR
ncbi:MAG TPA: UvrD-helicase domain-containing protein, partial [Planctomycetota bacterium]|nr:UvrD-helicase domain-containing protein [Planctomycetota bacterium]